MAHYTIYVGPSTTPDEVARCLGGEALPATEWTSLGTATFRVSSVHARSAGIIAEEYGILPCTRVAFQLEPDDGRGGRDTMLRAIGRVAAQVDDDLVAIAADDRPMLWRHGGRAIVNLDLLESCELERLGPPWLGGSASDLPPSIPFEEPAT